jgi:hypothetical protein
VAVSVYGIPGKIIYSNVVKLVTELPPPTISVGTNPQGQPVLTFTGALYEAGDVVGPYTKNQTATSPFTVTGATSGNKFYRAGP